MRTSTVIPIVMMLIPGTGLAQRPAIEFEPIVVTATKFERSADALPVRVSVFDGEQLRARGLRTVVDAISGVAGIATADNGSFGSVTSVFMRGGESNYVQVLVDGVAVNAPGGSYDFANLSLDNVERIEVLHGPASVLYGSDAISGVIHVITKDGTGGAKRTVAASAGTYGSWQVNGSASGGNDLGGYSVSFSNYSTNGLYTEGPGGGDFDNGHRNTVVAGRFTATPDDLSEASLSLRYTDTRYDFPTDGSGIIVDANSFTENRIATLGLSLRRTFGTSSELALRLSSHSSENTFDDSQDGASDTLGFYSFRSLDNVRRQTADLRLTHWMGRYSVTVGVEAEDQSIKGFSESESQFGSSNSSSDHERDNTAAYAQLVGRLGGVIDVTAGARVDDNERFGSFATYRLGANAHVTASTRLRGTVGKGFKEPTFAENFAQGFATGNPALDPEESTSWEVGFDQEFLDSRAEVGVSYFTQKYENLIQFTSTPPDPSQPNYFNVAEAKSAGLEVILRARPVGGLNVSAEGAFFDTEVVDAGFDTGDPDASFVEGERLLRRPDYTVTFTGTWTRGPLGLGAELRYVGDRTDRDFSSFPALRVELDDYVVVNLSGSFDLDLGGAPQTKLTLRVENLLDESYQSVIGFPAPGRTVMGGLRIGG